MRFSGVMDSWKTSRLGPILGWVGGLVGRLVDSLAEVDQQQLLDTGASDHPTDRFWALKGLRPDPMCVYIYLGPRSSNFAECFV